MVEVARIARALERHGERFYRRFFTEQEQAYCAGRIECLAGRFAVKEAVAKALGTGIGPVRWVEIEVVCDEQGKPDLLLHGEARARAAAAGLDQWSISLSHTASHAVGFAVGLSSAASGQRPSPGHAGQTTPQHTREE
jgi:holo-[acyl-carrier protein] synthase